MSYLKTLTTRSSQQIIRDYYTKVYFLRDKSEATKKLQEYISETKMQFNR